jgi:transcription initiation factor TFIIIB Brf1 subunit/transcription initiation factor TFIIB
MKEETARIAALVQIISTASQKLEYPAWEASRAAILTHKYVACFGATEIFASDKTELIFTAALLFLCGKASENIRSIRDVVNVVRRCKGQDIYSLETGAAYDQLKAAIMEKEQVILRAMALDLDSGQDQHKYLLNFCHFLSVTDDIAKAAVQLCNDTFLVAMCATRPPAVLAAACLYVAISLRNLKNEQHHHSSDQGRERTEDTAAASQQYCMWVRESLSRELQVKPSELESAAREVAQVQLQFATGSGGEITAVLE